MSKYYTPTIEEFHVGFEFEVKSYSRKPEDNNKEIWIKTEMKSVHLLDVYYVHNQTRVKYLDKEDIESLGFVYKEGETEQQNAAGNSVKYKRNCFIKHAAEYDYLLNYFEDTNTILIRCIPEDEHNYSSIRFLGHVKNKSELKVLLKQLGINE